MTSVSPELLWSSYAFKWVYLGSNEILTNRYYFVVVVLKDAWAYEFTKYFRLLKSEIQVRGVCVRVHPFVPPVPLWVKSYRKASTWEQRKPRRGARPQDVGGMDSLLLSAFVTKYSCGPESSASLFSHLFKKQSLTVTSFNFKGKLEKEMATYSSVLARRIPGTGEPGGLPSMGLHRVGHDCSDLAVVVVVWPFLIPPRMQVSPPAWQVAL